MTIITKPIGGEKKENELNKEKEAMGVPIPLPTDSDVLTTTPRTGGWVSGEDGPGPVSHADYYAAWRRRRAVTTICASLLVLWLLLSAILGGLLLFKHFYRRPRVYWCGTEFRHNRGHGGYSRYSKFQERIEIDPDGQFERIEVPKFGPNRPAGFLHDFQQNLTAIIDEYGRQCFLKPLNREQIQPPKDLRDLLEKLKTNYYAKSAKVVHENYRAELPALTEEDLMNTGSPYIVRACRGVPTFRLQKIYRAFERPGTRTRRSAENKDVNVAMFNGVDETVQIRISQ